MLCPGLPRSHRVRSFSAFLQAVTKTLPNLNREEWTNTLSKGLVTFTNGY